MFTINKTHSNHTYNHSLPPIIHTYVYSNERKWRSWADSHLVHLISPNVYQSWPEALETFEWFAKTGEWDDNFPRWERNLMVYVGAAAMCAISKRLKKRHNLTDDVRFHMYNACDEWTNMLGAKQLKFHGGKVPDLADVSVFGVLSSMEGCQAFKDCLKNTQIGRRILRFIIVIKKNNLFI